MYTFTNSFSGPSLHQRIVMMNRQQSNSGSWLRYAGIFIAVIVGALGCHWSAELQHRYMQRKNGILYGLITPCAKQTDIDTLQQLLARHHIILSIDTLARRSDGQISQIALTIQVPQPGHPISATVGSLTGQAAIPAIGLQCNESGCKLGAVEQTFPDRLKALAERESLHSLRPEPLYADESNQVKGVNAKFGLYRVFFRNDFLESCYFGLRGTAVRITSDYHLDLYPEYQKAVVFIDGQEANRQQLKAFQVIDLKKVVVFDGQAAVHRLGDQRAKYGLILVYRLPNMDIRDKYAATPLLEQVYPKLFTRQIGHVSVH